MVQIFNFFCVLLLTIFITGGGIFKRIHLDIATLDLYAALTLLSAILIWPKLERAWAYQKFTAGVQSPTFDRNLKRGFIAFFALLFFAHLGRHWSMLTNGFDVSFVHQALFNPWSNPMFPASISPTGRALGEHLMFSVLPISLITQYLRIDELLFLIQNLAVSIPLYCLVFKNPILSKKESFAWLALLIILTNRSMSNCLIFDFREDEVAYAGLIMAILSLWYGRASLYLLGLVTALLSKEYVFMVAIFFAPVILLSQKIPMDARKKRLLALATTVICAAYGILAFKFLLNYFNQGMHKELTIVSHLHQYGSSASEILMNVIFVPSNWPSVIGHAFQPMTITYLIRMLLPFAPFFICREAVIFAIPAFVGIALNAFTGYDHQVSMEYHYDLEALPFLAAGIIIGIGEYQSRKLLRPEEPKRYAYAFAFGLLCLCFGDKSPSWRFFHFWPSQDAINGRLALLHLDRNIPVLALERPAAQLNQHLDITVLRKDCLAFNGVNYSQFKGYVVTDPKDIDLLKCFPVSNAPLFSNSEVQIFEIK